MTRLVILCSFISAFAVACAGPESPCDDPDSCSPTHPDAAPAGPRCGDNVCQSTETVASCPADCHSTGPVCGDNTCDATETHASCPADCKCGDGVCEATETASSCPMDCQTTVDVVNHSGQTVFYLYAWSCTAPNKGSDLLGNTVLANGGSTTLTGPAGCWDFEADGSGMAYIAASYTNNLAGGQAYTWTIP